MKTLLIFMILLVTKTTYAQSFINIDIGNSILLRPNLGYEYRWKNKAIGGNIRWQRNAHIWVTEWPGFMKTNGLNLDLVFRYFYKKYVYTETGLRLTSFTAPFLVNGWQISSLHNSHKKIEPSVKIGLNTNKNKTIQWDLGVGVGPVISTKNLFLNESYLMDAQLIPYTENQLKDLYKKPKGVDYNWAPHAQLRLHIKWKK